MNITTENDITPETAKWLREQAKLTQGEFWRSVTASAPSGCRYEQGDAIPHPIRRLIFLTYVAKIPTDTSTREAAEASARAGQLFHINEAGGAQGVANAIADAMAHLKKASRALGI